MNFPSAFVVLIWPGLLLASGFRVSPISIVGPEFRMLWRRTDRYGQTRVYNTILCITVKGTVSRAGTIQILKVGNGKEMKCRELCKSQRAAKNNSRYGHMAVKLEQAFFLHRFQRIVKTAGTGWWFTQCTVRFRLPLPLFNYKGNLNNLK